MKTLTKLNSTLAMKYSVQMNEHWKEPLYYLAGILGGLWYNATHGYTASYLANIHITWGDMQHVVAQCLTAGFSAIAVKIFLQLWKWAIRGFRTFMVKRRK